jgi:hypothetical protein
MTVAAVKEKLHDYIDHANDKTVKAIYAFVENAIEKQDDIFNEEMMNILNERRENYLSGKSKTYTLEESIKNISKHRKKKNGL